MDADTDAQLYGFDAREPLGAPVPAWTPERRALYLLRPDIVQPLSVDTMVWPQVLPAGLTDGRASDYWASLDALRQACRAHGKAAVIVAMATLERCDAAMALQIGCEPATISPAWLPLGWDVADNGLISALSDCSYDPGPPEPDALRAAFGPHLNRYGLFDELAPALAFQANANLRVPEHAPFLVHRLWLVASEPPAPAGNDGC
jgi:hypothetical protein